MLHATRPGRGSAPDASAGREPPGRPRLGEQLERAEAQRLADVGWIEWGGELIWVAGYTSGGAPCGLRVCDFDRAELEAMGLDVEALADAGRLARAPSSIEEPATGSGTTMSHSELVRVTGAAAARYVHS